MNLLAIDASTDVATVAIMARGEVFSEEQGSIRQHAQFLLPMVQGLLSKVGLTFPQLDGIVFGRGPGSFTGLRIACSVAKGLAYAHDLPLFPVSGLSAIANEVYQTEADVTNVLAIIDARMNQVYWGCFTGASFDVQEHVSSVADISLGTLDSVILAGVGFESYAGLFSQSLQTKIRKQSCVFPNATAMMRLVQNGHINSVTAGEALPVYVRNQVTHGVEKGEFRG